MSGMGTSLQTDNPLVVAAFKSALLRQGLVLIAILAVLTIAWSLLRASALRQAAAGRPPTSPTASPEPLGYKVLRIGFGVLWLFDGILQAQVSMPLGLASGVITPAASSSPPWVRSLVGGGVTIWNNHPVSAAAATVWIQVGIGLFLLVAPRGVTMRLAGFASLTWGLLVWIFGEAFGGVFAPGLTVLFGAPGAALLYAVAGAFLLAGEARWNSARAGRLLLALLGAFYLGMALLQAWPGRGFWQGRLAHGTNGTLAGMVATMAQTSQPSWLSRLVSDFASFDTAHGFAVNLFAVVVIATIGLAYCTGRWRVVALALVVNIVFCLADWVLIEDLGFLGGVGTDPNSMLPLLVLATAGAAGLRRVPVAVTEVVADSRPLRERLLAEPARLLRSLAAGGCLVVIGLGAVPMAIASANPVADPILSEAIDGTPAVTELPLLSFSLEDQHGASVSSASLHGKAVALAFLDPVCTSDCPIIAQEMKQADGLLGSLAPRTEFVAIVANPLYNTIAATSAFDSTEGLSSLHNWLFLTGTVPQLSRLWNEYGVSVDVSPGGAMVAHADIAVLVDPNGKVREILNSDPGQATASMRSSFAGLVANGLRSLIPS